MKAKKNELVKSVKERLDAKEEFTAEEINELAAKWMEIADVDESGTIDIGELSEIVKKLDENFEESRVQDLFSAQDEESSGELAADKFGAALYEAIKLMNVE